MDDPKKELTDLLREVVRDWVMIRRRERGAGPYLQPTASIAPTWQLDEARGIDRTGSMDRVTETVAGGLASMAAETLGYDMNHRFHQGDGATKGRALGKVSTPRNGNAMVFQNQKRNCEGLTPAHTLRANRPPTRALLKSIRRMISGRSMNPRTKGVVLEPTERMEAKGSTP